MTTKPLHRRGPAALFIRAAPSLTIGVLIAPLVFGLAGTVLPAFGYLPALGGTHPTLAYFSELAASPGIARSALLSLACGLVTAAVSLAVVATFIAGWSQTPHFTRMQALLSPLLAIPHAAAAFGLAFMIAPSGYLIRLAAPLLGIETPPDVLIVNDPYGLSMMTGLIAKEIPFLFLVSLAALPQVKAVETLRLTRSLGYGRIAGFSFVVWPAVYRQIRFAVYAIIAYATSVVDVAAILGPTLPGTLALRLLSWMSDPDLSARFVASAGALLQIGVTLSALLVWWCGERLGGRLLRRWREKGARLLRDQALRYASLFAIGLSALIVLAGIALLGLWSVAAFWRFPDLLPQGVNLTTWMRALPRIVDPLVTTLAAGACSTLTALVLTIGCLERENRTGRSGGSRALLAVYLPLMVPQISFVFGLQVLFIASGTEKRFLALVLVHLIFVLPYVFLSLSDPWRAFDRRYESISLGFGRSRTATLLLIRLPMLTRAVLAAAAIGFAVSVGQYLPTVLIGEGRLTTITTEAVALASGGNRRVIGVYAFLQTLLPFLAFAIASAVPALLFRHRRAMRV